MGSEKNIDMKEHVKRANEKRKTEPNHVSVITIDALIESGLIDSEGNIIKKSVSVADDKKKKNFFEILPSAFISLLFFLKWDIIIQYE